MRKVTFDWRFKISKRGPEKKKADGCEIKKKDPEIQNRQMPEACIRVKCPNTKIK